MSASFQICRQLVTGERPPIMSKQDDEYNRWWNSLPEADRKMISEAWERHKAAAPNGGQDRPKDRPTDRLGVPYGVKQST